jgi:hypothetical protein
MKRMRYDEKVKQAIHAAVHEARKTKTWAESLAPAKEAGYKGNLAALSQFMATAKKPKAPAAAKEVAPATAVTAAPLAPAKKKRRTKMAVSAPAKAAAPAVSAQAPATSLDISALVHKTVTDAVVGALEGLLLSLKAAK